MKKGDSLMKKLAYALVALSLLLVLLPAMAVAHTEAAPYEVPLIAGQNSTIGTVSVWNDATSLYVKFVSTGDCLKETHVAVATNPADIPQTKKGNPIPGQFEYSDPHACVLQYTYEIPLTWDFGEDLYIAAHAATGVEASMWVFSNGDEAFTAYTGPGTTGSPCEQGSPRTGTAVAAWQHSAWGSVTSQFTYGTWIWEAYRAVDPICGTVVDFEETFDIPGEISDGTMWVTADNGYEAYLNGTLLETDGLSGDWRNSDLTEGYVTTAQAAWSSIEIASWLQLTGNTLRFETANEYFNTDDGHSALGTVDSNPGGLIYEAEITYYDDGETAWGNGTSFPGNNWGMYFTYTVQDHVCATVLQPVGGQQVVIAQTVLSDLGDLNISDSVKFKVTYPYPGGPAYFPTLSIDVNKDGIWDYTYEGWCVDTDNVIYQNTTYEANVYACGADLTGIVDQPENKGLVDHVLSQGWVGEPSVCGGNYTYGDVQRAIWTLIEDNQSTNGLNSWSQCRVDEILADAGWGP
jgi:hypothetical protein